MSYVKSVRYALAKNDRLNVIYWQDESGAGYFITLTADWYDKTGLTPLDALGVYCDLGVHPSAPVEDFNPMYDVPNRATCLNISGNAYVPYWPVDTKQIENNADLGNH